jgi:hypothetical protein
MSFFVLVRENKIPQVPIQATAESLVSLVIVSNVTADLCSGATWNETAGINIDENTVKTIHLSIWRSLQQKYQTNARLREKKTQTN